MQKQAPSFFQMATIVGFALSCFGLLLFLWVSFGGPTPLAARGYEMKVPFTEAGLLATQSDVRISGVSVGKVSGIELGDHGRAIATIELDDTYAPIPANTKAILRQKTLLGETYVELTPGDEQGPKLPDGGSLPAAQVSQATQLDEIFRTFDPDTRIAFQTWMRDAAVALRGRGVDLNNAFGELEPFFDDANKVVRTLDTQGAAVRQLVKNTGTVFHALSERRGQLRSLILNTEHVFNVTAQRDADLQALFTVFPTFLDESSLTLNRLDEFAANADPLVQQLRPAIRELSPTLISTANFSPYLRTFLLHLDPVIDAAPSGFPSLRRFLRQDAPPLLGALEPFTRDLDPLLQNVSLYRREIAAFLANGAATTNGVSNSPESGAQLYRLLRTAVPLGPDSIAAYPRRLRYNRSNPYVRPGGYARLGSGGLESFETRSCGGGINAIFRDWGGLTPQEQQDFEDSTGRGEELYQNLKRFAFANRDTSNLVPTPPCITQPARRPLGRPGRPATRYQHVFRAPPR
jgi:ABC-type transporter Mla subunit MlaD